MYSGPHKSDNAPLEVTLLYQYKVWNYFEERNLKVCETDDTCYTDCIRKAVHIREIHTQMPWYGSNNNFIFSDQTGLATKFKTLEEMKIALKAIDFKKSVDSNYG